MRACMSTSARARLCVRVYFVLFLVVYFVVLNEKSMSLTHCTWSPFLLASHGRSHFAVSFLCTVYCFFVNESVLKAKP